MKNIRRTSLERNLEKFVKQNSFKLNGAGMPINSQNKTISMNAPDLVKIQEAPSPTNKSRPQTSPASRNRELLDGSRSSVATRTAAEKTSDPFEIDIDSALADLTNYTGKLGAADKPVAPEGDATPAGQTGKNWIELMHQGHYDASLDPWPEAGKP